MLKLTVLVLISKLLESGIVIDCYANQLRPLYDDIKNGNVHEAHDQERDFPSMSDMAMKDVHGMISNMRRN